MKARERKARGRKPAGTGTSAPSRGSAAGKLRRARNGGKGASELEGKRVLLGITGSIAAYKAVELLRELTKRGASVTVCMTKAAREFVTPLTFEVLSGNRVLTDLFASSAETVAELGPEHASRAVQHIDAVADSDVVLVAPATGNIIGKVASGIADDLLSSIIMAAGGKVVFAPAMNVRMWESPVVKANVERLSSLGYGFIQPESGELACGETGQGRLASLESILDQVEAMLEEKRLLVGKSVLVSGGRTEEPIDDVRYISNRSSGKMAYALAAAARDMGADVTVVSGRTSVSPPHGVTLVNVRTASEMRERVVSNARGADMVFMVAAVSDFTPVAHRRGKISRDTEQLEISFRRTPDILAELGRKKGKRLLVGFAVETENAVRRGREKLKKKNLDLVVVNNPLVAGAGFEVDTNVVIMIDRFGKVQELPLMSKRDVAIEVLKKSVTLIAR